MNEQQHFQLIDGTFTPDQARQVLGAMVKSKIDFHSLVKHSEKERSGDSGLNSAERLIALRELDEKLKKLLISAKAEGKKLVVKGGFEITFAD